MSRSAVCTLVVLGLAAVLAPAPGCGGGGGAAPGPGGGGVTGAPVLLDLPLLWRDLDNNGAVSAGDQLIFRFDRPVAHGGGDPAVELLLSGPGTVMPGSSWTNGPGATELTVTLAAGSVLTPGLLPVTSTFNLGPNTIVNPDDPGAGNAVAAGASNSITVNFGLLAANVGAGNTRAVGAFDADGDVQIELVIGKTGPNEAYRSSAYAAYAGAAIPTGDPGLDTRWIAAGDLNGDTFLDFVTANFNGPDYVYINDGIGGFANAPAVPASLNQLGTGASRYAFLSSWDGAGGPDLFVANNGANYIYFSDGGGFFDGPAPGVLPGVQDRLLFPGGAVDTRAAVARDWDLAGLVDVITVDDPGGGLPAVITEHVLTATAAGTPPAIVSTAFPVGALAAPRSAAVTFYNADAIPDLLVGYDNGGGMQVWLQAPIGTWTLGATIPGGDVYALASFDLNQDGFDDVVQGRAGGQPDQILLNAGPGTFYVNAGLDLGSASTFALTFLNADGAFHVDLLAGSVTPNALWVTAR